MTENKRFIKYDGNTIVDLKLVKSWTISNGDVDLLIEFLNELNVDRQYEELQEVKKANEQLRSTNSILMKKLGEYKRKVKELEKKEEEKNCGKCKHFQLDGMFGMWCDLGKNWINEECCSDWER